MGIRTADLTRYWNFFAVAALGTVLTGCGGADNPATYPVSGIIQYKGKPLSNVGVTFSPSQGRAAVGRTDENGKFTLTTFDPDDGAIEGTHRVTVAEVVNPADDSSTLTAEDYGPPPPPPFPRRYLTAEMSDIEVKVPSDTESGEVTIELKD